MPAGDPLRLRVYDAIVREPLHRPDYLIEPLLLIGDRAMVYAEPGTMKTWIGIALGLSIATGRAWLDTFEVSRPQRVLYVDEEMNPGTFEDRVRRLGRGAALKDPAAVPFAVLSRPGFRFTDSGVDVGALLGVCSTFQPDVIIIDSLRRVIDGSENDAEAVGRLWRHVELIQDGRRTVIVIHHMKKPSFLGSGDVRHRASGSTDLSA